MCHFCMHWINLAGREELGMDVWVGHCCRRDQVRICFHRFRSNVDLSSDPSVQSFPKASLSVISVAVGSNRCMLHITFPPSAGIAGGRPSCSRYSLVLRRTTCSIWTHKTCRQSRCKLRRRLLSVRVESRSSKPLTVCVSPWSLTSIVSSHTPRLPLQSHGSAVPLVKNNSRQAVPPWEVLTLVGTLPT
jgi:hypothetical protein